MLRFICKYDKALPFVFAIRAGSVHWKKLSKAYLPLNIDKK